MILFGAISCWPYPAALLNTLLLGIPSLPASHGCHPELRPCLRRSSSVGVLTLTLGQQLADTFWVTSSASSLLSSFKSRAMRVPVMQRCLRCAAHWAICTRNSMSWQRSPWCRSYVSIRSSRWFFRLQLIAMAARTGDT
jgi:hypothetical protein